MLNFLKGKKILITAGPTWVAIDEVRVIGNISTGEMGIGLANEAIRNHCKVDLLLGPIGCVGLNKKISVKRFNYFHELADLVKKSLKAKKYDVIIHCAAVSDYLVRAKKGKISSSNKELIIRMERAPKIIDSMRKLSPDSCLVMFKLESRVSDDVLLKRAKEGLKKTQANLVVANTIDKKRYRGYILNSKGLLAKGSSKYVIANKLFKILKSD